MTGDEFLSQVSRRIADQEGSQPTDRQIARRLGISVQSLVQWKSRQAITARQMGGLLFKMEAAAVRSAEEKSIQPVVEFFPLSRTWAGSRYELFDPKDERGRIHPYRDGVHKQLASTHGVYIFYDSRGRGLYVGQARHQALWVEMNNAYNRRRQLQNIRRVDHPERRQDFRTSDELRRQIVNRNVCLYDLSYYFSAYSVADGMISNLEALLVRGLANDLLNVKMEHFKR